MNKLARGAAKTVLLYTPERYDDRRVCFANENEMCIYSRDRRRAANAAAQSEMKRKIRTTVHKRVNYRRTKPRMFDVWINSARNRRTRWSRYLYFARIFQSSLLSSEKSPVPPSQALG